MGVGERSRCAWLLPGSGTDPSSCAWLLPGYGTHTHTCAQTHTHLTINPYALTSSRLTRMHLAWCIWTVEVLWLVPSLGWARIHRGVCISSYARACSEPASSWYKLGWYMLTIVWKKGELALALSCYNSASVASHAYMASRMGCGTNTNACKHHDLAYFAYFTNMMSCFTNRKRSSMTLWQDYAIAARSLACTIASSIWINSHQYHAWTRICMADLAVYATQLHGMWHNRPARTLQAKAE